MSDEALLNYSATTKEIIVISDLINNHHILFEVKEHELKQEELIQEAVDKIAAASKTHSETVHLEAKLNHLL